MQAVLDYFAGLDKWGWLEIAAMVVGFYYVLLEIRKPKLLWYVCIATSILNIFVYWHNNYVSMTVLQFYYIATAVYGIYAFTKIHRQAVAQQLDKDAKPIAHDKVLIRRFDWKVGGITLAVGAVVFFILAPLLKSYAEAHGTALFPSQPYWDAFITVGSMIGTFFLSKSYMCQWYIWIGLDILTVAVFIRSGMYWMALLFSSYIVISCLGIRNWRKNGVYVDKEKGRR